MKPELHSDCAAFLRDMFADLGAEITAATAPPIVDNPYTQTYTCPHGIQFWVEPTGEQIAQWVRDGVE